jgi:ribosomal-protein-alanine N-acetyltransferase
MTPNEVIARTERLRLRPLALPDAPFIMELMNDPDWLLHIGDRNIRSLEDAQRYIQTGPMSMYVAVGHGPWAVELAESDGPAAIGICGLIKRETLPDVDVGYAFLPQFRGKGFAREAVKGTLRYARDVLQKERILAITSLGNQRSIHLLSVLGFADTGVVRLPGSAEEIRLFSLNVTAASEHE